MKDNFIIQELKEYMEADSNLIKQNIDQQKEMLRYIIFNTYIRSSIAFPRKLSRQMETRDFGIWPLMESYKSNFEQNCIKSVTVAQMRI